MNTMMRFSRIAVPAIAGAALCLDAAACGGAKGLAGGVMSMSTSAANAQINSDLKRAPYMACQFDTSAAALVRVVERQLIAARYEVTGISADEVRTKPSVTRQLSSGWHVEMLTAKVMPRGDSTLVWLRFQIGPSEQQTKFHSSDGKEPVTSHNQGDYGDLMKRIAADVKRTDCASRRGG